MEDLNKISEIIIGNAIEVHKELGPGLLESSYETCLVYELSQYGFKIEQQKSIPINYKGVTLDCGYRIDVLVEDSIIIELKSVEQILPVHRSQVLSYLRLSNLRLGLLINFNVELLKNGISRIINPNHPSAPSALKPRYSNECETSLHGTPPITSNHQPSPPSAPSATSALKNQDAIE